MPDTQRCAVVYTRISDARAEVNDDPSAQGRRRRLTSTGLEDQEKCCRDLPALARISHQIWSLPAWAWQSLDPHWSPDYVPSALRPDFGRHARCSGHPAVCRVVTPPPAQEAARSQPLSP
jgi:hypothetical protein